MGKNDLHILNPEPDDDVKELIKNVPQTHAHPGHLLPDGSVAFPTPNLTNHRWRQRGIYVKCDTCPVPHGFTLETDKQLTGIDANGYPVIKSISVKA